MCVAGTYIRSLARDIGEVLGCGGHLTALRRTQAGQFSIGDAVTIDALEQAAREGRAEALLLPMDRAVSDWPEVTLDAEQTKRLLNGQTIALTQAPAHVFALTPNPSRCRGRGGGSEGARV